MHEFLRVFLLSNESVAFSFTSPHPREEAPELIFQSIEHLEAFFKSSLLVCVCAPVCKYTFPLSLPCWIEISNDNFDSFSLQKFLLKN